MFSDYEHDSYSFYCVFVNNNKSVGQHHFPAAGVCSGPPVGLLKACPV